MGLGKLSVLKKRIPKIAEETEKARVAKRERKKKKKLPDYSLENPECGQNKKKKVTWYTVQNWFKQGIEGRISWSVASPIGDWGGKQRFLATKLLKAYDHDGDLVKKAIFYLCDNWE